MLMISGTQVDHQEVRGKDQLPQWKGIRQEQGTGLNEQILLTGKITIFIIGLKSIGSFCLQ